MVTTLKVKTAILLAPVFLLSFKAYSRPYTITGRVLSEANKPATLYNVLVLSAKDSALIKGACFFNENFKMEGIAQEQVIVKIMALGYQPVFKPVAGSGNSSTIDIGILTLQPNAALTATEIVADKPLFEEKEGNTRINVQNTLLSANTSVLEVLSKSPNIMVSNNSVEVAGKGPAIFYLKGKRIPPERLSAIPVNQIEAIDIISNPGAKYDASGQAVINIVLKQNPAEGAQAMLTQQFRQARYLQSYTEMDYNYQKGKFSLSSVAAFNANRSKGYEYINTTLKNKTGPVNSMLDFEQTDKKNAPEYSIGAAYDLGRKSTVSLEYSGDINNSFTKIDTKNQVQQPNDTLLIVTGQSNNSSYYYNQHLSSNYYWKADSLGSNLFVGAQYSLFNNQNNNLISETHTTEQAHSDLLSNAKETGAIQIRTIQSDYQQFYKNGQLLELGFKYTDAISVSDITFYSKPATAADYIFYPDFSNKYRYAEKIPAAYLQFSGGFKKIKYNVGLRSELTHANGYSNTHGKSVIDTTYLNVFPSAKLQTVIHDIKLSLSYSTRIQRPSYHELDPYVYYATSALSAQGNPYLLPQYTHSLEAKTSWRGFGVAAGYSYFKNPQQSLFVAKNDSTTILVLRRINIESGTRIYTTLTIPVRFKIWEANNSITFSKRQLADSHTGLITAALIPEFTVSSNNRIRINKSLSVELNGKYTSRRSDGFMTHNAYYMLALGITKTFLKEQLAVNLLVNDFFGVNTRSRYYTILTTTGYGKSLIDSYYYQLTLRYNFGNLKNVAYKNKSVNEEEKQRISPK